MNTDRLRAFLQRMDDKDADLLAQKASSELDVGYDEAKTEIKRIRRRSFLKKGAIIGGSAVGAFLLGTLTGGRVLASPGEKPILGGIPDRPGVHSRSRSTRPGAVRYTNGDVDKIFVSYYGPLDSKLKLYCYKLVPSGGEVEQEVSLRELPRDWHADGSILIHQPDERIVVFHSRSESWYWISKKPLDILQMEEKPLPRGPGLTYPKPAQLESEDNKIFLFRRGVDRDEFYMTTDDIYDEEAWTDETRITDTGDDTVYAKQFVEDPKIHLFWTSGAWHRATGKTTLVSYVYYERGEFYDVDGNLLTLPLTRATMPVVNESPDTKQKAHMNNDIMVKDGIIYLLYEFDRELWYSYHDGDNWNHKLVTDDLPDKPPWADSGLQTACIDRLNPNRVYLSRQTEVAEYGDVFSAETQDGGDTWTFKRITEHPEPDRHFTPIENPPDKPRFLWLRGKTARLGTMIMSEPFRELQGVGVPD